MKVAKLIDNKYVIGSIFEFFPNVSFPDIGIPDSFLEENNLYKVDEVGQCNDSIEKIVLLNEPILKNNKVYTFEIVSKTQQEITDEKWQKIRSQRDKLLLESDVYVIIDRWENYTEEFKTALRNYRQALRDLPQTIQDFNNINWPIKPSVNNNR